MMVDLSNLRAAIGWGDRDAWQAALKEIGDRTRRSDESDATSQLLAKSLGVPVAALLPGMKAEREQLEAHVAKMLAADASLPRPDDSLQVVHLRNRLEDVKLRALTLLNLATRSPSSGWVRAERVKRVQEQLPEIQRLTALIRRLEATS